MFVGQIGPTSMLGISKLLVPTDAFNHNETKDCFQRPNVTK